MTDDNDEQTGKKMSSRQRLRYILKRMGQPTPEEQALDFHRAYVANWMKKQGRGGSSEQT